MRKRNGLGEDGEKEEEGRRDFYFRVPSVSSCDSCPWTKPEKIAPDCWDLYCCHCLVSHLVTVV